MKVVRLDSLKTKVGFLLMSAFMRVGRYVYAQVQGSLKQITGRTVVTAHP